MSSRSAWLIPVGTFVAGAGLTVAVTLARTDVTFWRAWGYLSVSLMALGVLMVGSGIVMALRSSDDDVGPKQSQTSGDNSTNFQAAGDMTFGPPIRDNDEKDEDGNGTRGR